MSSAPSSVVPSARGSLILPSGLQAPRSSISSGAVALTASSSLSFTLLDQAVTRLTDTSNSFKANQRRRTSPAQFNQVADTNSNTNANNLVEASSEAVAIIAEVDACLALLKQAKLQFLALTAAQAPSQVVASALKTDLLQLRRSQSEAAGEDEDVEVVDWLAKEYSNQQIESETQGIKTTLLCMRFINKTRERISRQHETRRSFNELAQITLQPKVYDILNDLTKGTQSWDFDIFALEKEVGGPKTLSVLVYHLFNQLGLFDQLYLRKDNFYRFFNQIENGYLQNPYHNAIHGADVAATTYWFLTREPLFSTIVRKEDLLSAIIAAAIHDFKHPGTNNAFQIATKSDLSIRYNDRSVLENMHCAEAFSIMRSPENDILSSLPPEKRAETRSSIINMVLGTDMQLHFTHLAELKTHLEKKRRKFLSPDQTASPSPSPNTMSPGPSGHGNNSSSSSVGPSSGSIDESSLQSVAQQLVCGGFTSEPADRALVLMTAVHCADLANVCKPLPIYLEWAHRVMEEFYQQGDKERELGLPITPMMDRKKPNMERSQLGFMDVVVKPLYESFQQICAPATRCLAEMEKNHAYFQARIGNASALNNALRRAINNSNSSNTK